MKKLLLSILMVLFFTSSAFSAWPTSMIWEIQQAATAANVNGGGFDPVSGTPGTDWSIYPTCKVSWIPLSAGTCAQTSATNTVADLASVAGTKVVTSATYTFTAADVGNIINITDTGTGAHCPLARYQIISVAAGQATLDKILDDGTACVAGQGYMGGALSLGTATDDAIFEQFDPGNVVFVKYDAGNPTITLGGAVTITKAGTLASPINLVGYTTTRTLTNTDTTLETIAVGSAAAITFGTAWNVRNLAFTGSYTDLIITGASGVFERIKSTNSSATAARKAIKMNASSVLFGSEIVSTAGVAVRMDSTSVKVIGNYIHDSNIGIDVGGATPIILGNLIEGNTTYGIQIAATYDNAIIYGNTLYGVASGDTGISGGDNEASIFINNNISNFATKAINLSAYANNNFSNYNNYYNITTTTNLTKGSNDLNVNPELSAAFVPGTGLKAMGYPGLFMGSATTGYMDIGAVQRVEPAASGGGAWAQ